MSKTTTPVNYTAEQTAEMLDAYKAKPERATVESLAASMGRSFRSVVAKLSREGVYQKAEPTAKDGSPVVSKAQLADAIAFAVGLNEEEADSLTKATKSTLQKLLDVVSAKE